MKTLKEAPSNDDLLELYALFKQATAGDVTGSRPGMMDFKGRAKFDAWTKGGKNQIAGVYGQHLLSKEVTEAMKRYLDTNGSLLAAC